MSKGSQENDQILDAVALVVVDVQERLLPHMADGEAFTDRVAFAIEAARVFGLDVIFTEQVPDKLGHTLPRLKKLAPKVPVFSKTTFSAFQADGIQDHLRDRNIYHLLICGLETPVCIYQTALQAADLELDTTLLSDCLTSRRPEDDAYVLSSLSRSGCHVLPSEAVFYSMIADARNPRFRTFSELVKKYQCLRTGETPPPTARKAARTPRSDNKKVDAPVRKSPDASTGPKDKDAPRPPGRRRKKNLGEASGNSERTTAADVKEPDGTEPKKAETRQPRRRRRTSRSKQRQDGDA